ncbi:MAG: hypothetical protein K2X74_01395 [Acetobacteraceae bacterium]|nr:hypothetical protein [Acetobacteraceae bacterium]
MPIRHRYKFNDTGTTDSTSAFQSYVTSGADRSVLEGGRKVGRDAFDFASSTGNIGGASEARGNGALLTSFTVVGNLGDISNPGGDPGGSFTIKRATFAASFHETVTFDVVAVLDGQEVSRQQITVGPERTKINLGIGGVDYVAFFVRDTGPQLPLNVTVTQSSNYPPLLIDNLATSSTLDPLI